MKQVEPERLVFMSPVHQKIDFKALEPRVPHLPNEDVWGLRSCLEQSTDMAQVFSISTELS